MNGKKLLFLLVLASWVTPLGFTAPRRSSSLLRERAGAHDVSRLEKSFYLAEFDSAGRVPTAFHPLLACTASYRRGDFNENKYWDFEDAVFLLNCVFANSGGPLCLVCIGDMNCDKTLSAVDVVMLLNFIVEPPLLEIRCPG